MFKSKLFLCACLCILAVLATVARSDDIKVRNPRRDQSITLSDFIVYGEVPNKQQKVIRAPDDPNDDTVIPGWGVRIFTADFKIKKYIISSCFIDEGHYVEHEIVVFEVEKIVPKKLSFIRDPDEQQTVVLAVDQAIAPDPPPEGTVLAFVEGYNELMPGWFVGTGINFDTSEVTGAYTGNVEVFCTAFEVLVFIPPYPPDGAVDIPVDADLHWPESEDAESYDVYFGTSSPPPFIGNLALESYDPGGLEWDTAYYWKIDEYVLEVEEVKVGRRFEFIIIEEYEVCYEGPVWSFTTAGRKATNPYPVDGAIHVGPNVLLSWTPGCCAASHDVYFGTNFEDVNDGTLFTFKGNQDANSYDPGGLELCRTYYWRVDEVKDLNDLPPDTWKGDLWSFMTDGEPDPNELPDEEPVPPPVW